MKLHTLAPARGARSAPKRVGRGIGSGLGKTAGRGEKGQKSRTGYSSRPGFEGGQMPLYRRVPKRGFTNIFRQEIAEVNLDRLADLTAGTEVTPDLMRQRRWIPRRAMPVKVLGNGDVSVALTVRAHRFSKSAIAKIEAAGGRIEVLAVRPRGPSKPREDRRALRRAAARQAAGGAAR
jgi:large subunit ribosomal protein L15